LQIGDVLQMLCAVAAMLRRRLPPMAIRAPHDTLVNLGLQSLYRRASHDHSADISKFRTTNVIEVKDQDVSFVTVDARVPRKKIEYQSSVALRIAEMERITPGVVSA
jgi:hypothetical protein